MAEHTVVSNAAFFEKAQVGMAKDFGAGFKHLAMSDVTRIGHEFRLFQQDPTAEALEAKAGPIPERVIGKRNFLPASFLASGAERARAVCKIQTDGTDYSGSPGSWAGTGFLVSPNLLLTNHHVLNSIETARAAVCMFNYETSASGETDEETQTFRLQPDELFVTSPLQGGLDYTFVWIESAAAERQGYVRMRRSAFTIHPGDQANVIQHPDGRKKEIAIHDNEALQDTGLLLHFATDTEGGSSGSPVFNNRWDLIALHHASTANDSNLTLPDGTKPDFLNEGIKLSAIAADLEVRNQSGMDTPAGRVLRAFEGVDSLFGFFGSLGRSSGKEGANSIERLVNVYSGEPDDVDVGFWNIEWFAKRYQEKLDAVATLVADLNLDIWSLAESSPEATRALVAKLDERFSLKYECAFSEPDAASGKQSTTVLWNTATVKGERRDWPREIDAWFGVRSEQFQGLDLEAVHGKVFDRYPGLFYFETKNAKNGLGFHLVPLHLKAMDEGSLRRRMASKILASAVKKMVIAGADEDWVIGGDFNAEMATGDFQDLGGSLFPVSGEDEDQGAFTYLKSPRSLIDHIYLSANLCRTFGPNDFFIVARDHDIPDYVKRVSDHRPVLVRLSRGTGGGPSTPPPASLVSALGLHLSGANRHTPRKAEGQVRAKAATRPPVRVRGPKAHAKRPVRAVAKARPKARAGTRRR